MSRPDPNRPEPKADRSNWTITWERGAEYSPDSPDGRDVLNLRLDGSVQYEHRRQGQRHACGALASADQVKAWLAALDAAGFPQVPDPQVEPGAWLVSLTMRGPYGASTARFDLRSARDWSGYGDLVAIADAWAMYLRSWPTEASPPEGLTDVTRLD